MSLFSYSLYTLFDITRTGITRSYSSETPSRLDLAGQKVNNENSWTRSRNQQRNWETIIQLISLRAQVTPIDPKRLDNQELANYNFDPVYGKRASVWVIRFYVETQDLFLYDTNSVGLLEQDFDRIPMIIGLTETAAITPPLIITNLPGINTTFTFVAI